jgi:DNA-binding FadR family transcriptional regulator
VATARKLADIVARRIERDIAAKGWPVGEVLGSEPDLLEQYGVSRAVFREAVRLIEHKRIGQMRRGPGGGLVVTAPELAAVQEAATVYLQYERVGLDELFEARIAIEETGLELLAATLSEDTIGALRRLEATLSPDGTPDPVDPHVALAALTGNPAIELFARICTGLTSTYLDVNARSPRVEATAGRDAATAHQLIIQALAEGNGGLARHLLRSHLEAYAAHLSSGTARGAGAATPLLEADGRDSKRAELLSREIYRDIVARGWPVGEVWGSESELMAAHGVSRAVLREAVRLLEHHQIAVMRRGPGGGLVVTAPTLDATAAAVALYLDHRRVTLAHINTARLGMELAAARLAVERLDDGSRADLLDALGTERAHHRAAAQADTHREEQVRRQLADTSTAEDLLERANAVHRTIARLSGNRILDLFISVVLRLGLEHTDTKRLSDNVLSRTASSVYRAHEAIVEALLAGDVDIALHRLRHHLNALRPWQQ